MRTKRRKPESGWQTSERYVNREFSWMLFNKRVLEEAANPKNPLLERLRFLSIFESNLDEFFMVRVSGLIEQAEAGVKEKTPDGLTPGEQLKLIGETCAALRREVDDLWRDQLRPEMERHGISFLTWDMLDEAQQTNLAAYFRKEVFSICTPILLDPTPSAPFISNRSLNLAVELGDAATGIKLARIKVPTVIERAIPIVEGHEYILLEDLIRANLDQLFPGVAIRGAWGFRVIRDADFEIRELEAADLISSVEETIKRRRFGDVVLLEVDHQMPERARQTLMNLLELDESDLLMVDGLMGLDVLLEIFDDGDARLKFPQFAPYVNEKISQSKSLFEAISARDLLIHQPYDSFKSVLEFVHAAAADPDVIGIKQTLYRVGSESPIVESLLAAAEAGKQVAVMVELKARFDESNNLGWARALERAGVHVSYGFPEMKVHCKLCMVTRREEHGLQTYCHIGTGNYNPTTARIYTDLGFFTCDQDIAQDVSELFNYLTGFSKQISYRKILAAPHNLRDGILQEIEREIEHCRENGSGQIIMKLNSLVDPEVIEALYEASQAGVSVDLIVRGICCLRPGKAGMSENIRVRSIVGRFLEHSRAYYFGGGGSPTVWIGSSDLMRRNLDRRIEVLVPIREPSLVSLIHDELLMTCLQDNTNSWTERSDGTYERLYPHSGDDAVSAQNTLMTRPFTKIEFS